MIKGGCRRPTAILFVLVSVASAYIPATKEALAETQKPTKLYLVGVGPGDPDLMTLRAIRVIKEADLVVCREAVGEKLASYLDGKERVPLDWGLFRYYGNDPSQLEGQQRRECEKIARKRNLLIAKVRRTIGEGKTVAILNRGDPVIYGPSTWCLEEFEDLAPVVVPGLSCFNAANAALRKGITTGERTRSVILTAGDWPGMTDTLDKLSVHRCTMVVFTMGTAFQTFVEKLSINYPPETPVAIVKHAGYVEKEEVVRGTLGTIAEQVRQEDLPFEYLIYVGDFLTYRYKRTHQVAAP